MPTTIDALRAETRGQVITADAAGYDEHRIVNNAMHDRRPAMIVRCTDAADVIAAVALRTRRRSRCRRPRRRSQRGWFRHLRRRRRDRPVSDGECSSRRPRRTARAGGGATWGDFDHATHVAGMATTGGIISTTGVGGLTLGGGIGYLARRCGLTIDSLVAADVVTADGRLVVASEHENEDLFWALRGGGGNFGVVTSLEYELHDVSTIVGGPMLYEVADAAAVMQFSGTTSPKRPRSSAASSPGRSPRRCRSSPRSDTATCSAGSSAAGQARPTRPSGC